MLQDTCGLGSPWINATTEANSGRLSVHFSGSWQIQEPTDHRGRLNSAPYICLSCLTLATPLCSSLGNTVGTHISSSSHWFPHPVLTSIQFSRSVVSDSLRPHESQHARPPCLSPTPRVHSDSCPSSQ